MSRTCEHDGHLLVDGGVPAGLALQQVRRRSLAAHPRPVDLLLRQNDQSLSSVAVSSSTGHERANLPLSDQHACP